MLEIVNSVLIYTPNKKIKEADATLSLTRNIFDQITTKQRNVMQIISDGDIKLTGSRHKFEEFMGSIQETVSTLK